MTTAFGCAGSPPSRFTLETASAPQKSESIRFPAHWQALDSIRIADSPDYPSTGCALPSIQHDETPGKLGLFLVGDDTVYVDRVRSFYWPWDSYDACKLLYADMNDSLRAAMRTYYDPDSGASRQLAKKLRYEAIPTLSKEIHDGREFIYVIQDSYLHTGPWGLFFPGDSTTRPLNIYGYNLSWKTKWDILDFFEKIEFR